MSFETIAMPTIEQAAICSDSEPPAAPTTEEAPPATQSKMPAPKHILVGHARVVWDFVFLHDNVHIVTGSLDGTMRKWDCDTGLIVGEPWKGDGGEVWAMALSPDGKTIACGRMDGSVQRWDTDGQMNKAVWRGHSGIVRSLSWSPSGNHIASGSQDGTIVIRKVENGEIEVGPIESMQDLVLAVAYSPLGDKIASGGRNNTICVWDKTGRSLLLLRVSEYVASVVWSLDGAKLYCTSDSFAYVFDSFSGDELHRFKHDNPLHSIALSPKHNLLACVGFEGIAQLWDTESHQSLGQPFSQEGRIIECVSFSRDGRYLAYGGCEGTLTLWIVKDIVPELPSPAPSCLEIDATNPCAQSGSDDYGDFFQPHHPSAPSGPFSRFKGPGPSSAHRLWNFLFSSPASESVALQPRTKRSLFARHTGPRPVTVAAGRKKKRIYVARPPVKATAQTSQSSSAVAHSVAQPSSTTQSQPQSHPQVQTTTTQQPTQAEEYGCWGNFCLVLGCIPRPIHTVVSAAQPAVSES